MPSSSFKKSSSSIETSSTTGEADFLAEDFLLEGTPSGTLTWTLVVSSETSFFIIFFGFGYHYLCMIYKYINLFMIYKWYYLL